MKCTDRQDMEIRILGNYGFRENKNFSVPNRSGQTGSTLRGERAHATLPAAIRRLEKFIVSTSIQVGKNIVIGTFTDQEKRSVSSYSLYIPCTDKSVKYLAL